MTRLFFLACLSALLLTAYARPPVKVADAERQGLYRWFDSLGNTEKFKGQFGEIQTYYNGTPSRRLHTFGFLLSRTASSSSFFTLGQTTETYRKGATSFGMPISAELRPLDFKQWLTERKETFQAQRYVDLNIESHGFFFVDNSNATLFILARIADLRGYRALADWFYSNAKADQSVDPKYASASFATRLKINLADLYLNSAYADVDDLSLSRDRLHSIFQAIPDRFPACDATEAAKGYADSLAAMAREDANRRPLSAAQLAALPVGRRIEELIWQLRNQNGHETEDPGATDILATDQAEGQSPAERLAEIGLPAVPALIDRLSDRTLTRSVDCVRSRAQGILSVRDAAEQILSRIAGRQFVNGDEYQRIVAELGGANDWRPQKRERLAAAESVVFAKNAKKWWSQVKSGGERELLINAVTRGDYGSIEQANLLVKKYPDAALVAVRAGVAKEKDEGTAGQLLDTIAEIKSPQVRAYAADEMRTGKTFSVRFAAAKIVYKTDPINAVRAMVKEKDEGEELTDFLAEDGSPEALGALCSGIKQKEVSERVNILLSLGTAAKQRRSLTAEERQQSRAIAEETLVSELTDRDKSQGEGMNGPGFDFENPRACDIACFSLSRLFPSRYHFLPKTSQRAGNEQCILNLNVYRTAKGLTPLAIPARETVPEVAAVAIDPLLSKLAEGQATASEFVKLGVGAIPPLLRYQKTLPAARRAVAENIAVQIGNIVRKIVLVGAPAGAAAFENEAKALKGSPLNENLFIGLLRSFIKTWPGKSPGIRVRAERDDDGIGFTLTVTFDPPTGHLSSQVDNANIEQSVEVNGKGGNSGGGSGQPESLLESGEMILAFRKAFSQPPATPVAVEVHIYRPQQ